MKTLNDLVQAELGGLAFKMLAVMAENQELQHKLAVATIELAKAQARLAAAQPASPELE